MNKIFKCVIIGNSKVDSINNIIYLCKIQIFNTF